MMEQSGKLLAREAARFLRVSASTLAKWRMRREGPPFHRCGPKIVVYYRDELDAWLASRVGMGSSVRGLRGQP